MNLYTIILFFIYSLIPPCNYLDSSMTVQTLKRKHAWPSLRQTSWSVDQSARRLPKNEESSSSNPVSARLSSNFSLSSI